MTFLNQLHPTFKIIIQVIDVTVVYLLIYRFLVWIKGTQAYYLLKGVLWVALIWIASDILELATVNWIVKQFATVILLVIIIIFQPELRRFLERIGTGNVSSKTLLQSDGKSAVIIKQLLKTIDILSKDKIGALIVIEVGNNLSDYIESGIRINGEISAELLSTLFWIGSPTHDGAVVIQSNRVVAAGCLLPLSAKGLSDQRVGTRHRAAIGLSEITDALIIVVSEETGVISLAESGNLNRYLSKEALETRLFNLYKEDTTKTPSIKSIMGLKNKKTNHG